MSLYEESTLRVPTLSKALVTRGTQSDADTPLGTPWQMASHVDTSNGFMLSDRTLRRLQSKLDEQRDDQHIPTCGAKAKEISLQRGLARPGAAQELWWAIRELLQNSFDFSSAAIDVGAKDSVWHPIEGNTDVICIGRKRRAAIVIALQGQELLIAQFGRPLGEGSLIQNTQSKSAAGSAGGFGDGYKSAYLAFLARGYSGSFEFYNFQAPNRNAGRSTRYHRVLWEFCSKPLHGQNTMHVKTSNSLHNMDGHIGGPLLAGARWTGNAPIMVARVRQATGLPIKDLRNGAAIALSMFVAMYNPTSLPREVIVSLADNDRWVRRDAFEPVVEAFAGTFLGLHHLPVNGGVLALHGIFYQLPMGEVGSNTVIFMPGRGFDTEEDEYITIFKNFFRLVDSIAFAFRFMNQLQRFLTTDASRDDASRLFSKLLVDTAIQLDDDSSDTGVDDEWESEVVLCPTRTRTPKALTLQCSTTNRQRILVQRAAKRAALGRAGFKDVSDEQADSAPIVSVADYGQAQYLLSLSSDEAVSAIRVPDTNAVDTDIFPLSTIDTLKRAVTDGSLIPFRCDRITGVFERTAKLLLGEAAVVCAVRNGSLNPGAVPCHLRLDTRLVVPIAPAHDDEGLLNFMAHATNSLGEKRMMVELFSEFRVLNLEHPDRGFVANLEAAINAIDARNTEIASDDSSDPDPEEEEEAVGEEEIKPEPEPEPELEEDDEDEEEYASEHGPESADDDDYDPVPPPLPTVPPPPVIPPFIPPVPPPVEPPPLVEFGRGGGLRMHSDEEEEEQGNGRRVRRRTRRDPLPRIVTIVPVPDSVPPSTEIDPLPTRDLEQNLNEEYSIYTPTGAAPEATRETVLERMQLMERAFSIVEEHIEGADLSRVRISWSPDADWAGLHEANRNIYVNLALLPTTMAKYLGVLTHEVAHDDSHAHGLTWGMSMQRKFEALIRGILAEAEGR